jgi:hypothetical protein
MKNLSTFSHSIIVARSRPSCSDRQEAIAEIARRYRTLVDDFEKGKGKQ